MQAVCCRCARLACAELEDYASVFKGLPFMDGPPDPLEEAKDAVPPAVRACVRAGLDGAAILRRNTDVRSVSCMVL